jgi:hypothetical protein
MAWVPPPPPLVLPPVDWPPPVLAAGDPPLQAARNPTAAATHAPDTNFLKIMRNLIRAIRFDVTPRACDARLNQAATVVTSRYSAPAGLGVRTVCFKG